MISLAAQFVRPNVYVGPAFPRDADAISRLVCEATGDCLPVEERQVLARLSEFEVARTPSGQVLGCAAVHDADGRAELCSVSVSRAWRGAGVGRCLVERAAKRAFAARQDLFCVSRSPEFFESLGFSRLPPEAVPERPGVTPGGRPRCALVRRSRGSARLSCGA